MANPVPVSLSLVVCATARNGIGRGGRLPWRLPIDLAFFKHVTTLVSAPSAPARNVVVMGRKTWESIPARFRPLPGRLNIVISRSTAQSLEISPESNDVLLADSLPSACKLIQSLQLSGKAGAIYRTFLIGGGQLYREALEKPSLEGVYELERIMMTRIVDEGSVPLECDAFLPDFTALSCPAGGREWACCAPTELEDWLHTTSSELEQLGFSSVEARQDGLMQLVFQLWKRCTSLLPPSQQA